MQLLRTRIELLEQALRSNSIDVDEAVAKSAVDLDSARYSIASPHGSGTDTSNFKQLCAVYEGALSLDESLTFDQDGEVRYFGLTSGRLDFQPSKSSAVCSLNAFLTNVQSMNQMVYMRLRPVQQMFRPL